MIAAYALAAATQVPALEDPREPRWVRPIVHASILFTAMRATETWLWPHPFAETEDFDDHYREAFTKPPLFDPHRDVFEWDGDRWFINVLGHGLLGSELHLRARQCGFSVLGALAWTAGASAVWEYGFEANGVRPSALDLVWTPLAGLALGEARLALFRAASSIDSRFTRSVVRVLVDPLGELDQVITGDACGHEPRTPPPSLSHHVTPE